jgi:type II secretory pathway predicted ATPase ExeA
VRQRDLTVLVIDSAQSPRLLEEIRLLANLEAETDKLLPLGRAGQPQLRGRLNRPGLRHLKQRFALRSTLTPLSLRETALRTLPAHPTGRLAEPLLNTDLPSEDHVFCGWSSRPLETPRAAQAKHRFPRPFNW